jgi:UDP-N-acetylmuramate dehydrogenase
LYSLQTFHSFGFPSQAQELQHISSLSQARQHLYPQPRQPYYIIGAGSNTVFLEDFCGTVYTIAIHGIELRETDSAYLLEVGAGENWHQLVEWCLARKIYGFENLALIPGTVGAAPIQNIGAYGLEIEQFIESVEYLCLRSGEIKQLSREQCAFAYRDSIFKQQLAGQFVIGKVKFKLLKNWQANTHYAELRELNHPSAHEIFAKVVAVRQAKLPDPAILGNAGSFFKNPVVSKQHWQTLQIEFPTLPCYQVDEHSVKIPAAWLIDQLGFKGQWQGGIQCHAIQPLVLVNARQGTGEQLLLLARSIKHKVSEVFAITLENEVQLLGADKAITL